MGKVIKFEKSWHVEDMYFQVGKESDYRPGESGLVIGACIVNKTPCLIVEFSDGMTDFFDLNSIKNMKIDEEEEYEPPSCA